MPRLARRAWVPAACEDLIARHAALTEASGDTAVAARIEALADRNAQIHDRDCFNLNPATNVMNPRAEALLSRGLG